MLGCSVVVHIPRINSGIGFLDTLDVCTSPACLHHPDALPGEGSDTLGFDAAVDAAQVANDVLVVSIYKPDNVNPEKDERKSTWVVEGGSGGWRINAISRHFSGGSTPGISFCFLSLHPAMVSVDLALYSVLRVSRHATDAQIRGAYRLRALATHPDKGGNEEEFLKAGNCRPWSGNEW